MVTETDALQRLTEWLEQNKWMIWQDKKNDIGNPTFHVKGISRKKPDLIIKKKGYTIAIEVKSGTDSLPLRTNSDLVTYFCNYNEGNTFYFDDNKNILSINDFVLGTYYSPDGYLKEGEALKQCSERHYNAFLQGRNPKKEYSESFQIIRGSIWDVIKFQGCYQQYKQMTTGVGALLSTILDDDENKTPGFFVMKNHIRWDGSNRTWWHQWMKF